MFFKQGCAQNRSISAWREKPLEDRKGFSFNFCVHKRKVIIYCDQNVFKSLLSGSHLSFTAELSWHYPSLLSGTFCTRSAGAERRQIQLKSCPVGQDKVKGKSVFLQVSQCSCRVSDCYTFMKETCAKIPFQNLGQGGATHWINANIVKGNNSPHPDPWKMRNSMSSLIPVQVFWCQPSFTGTVVETEVPHVTSFGSSPYLCEMSVKFNEGLWFLTTALQDAISFTRSITSWLNVVGQNTCDTSPLLQASCAVSFLPQNNISFACETKRLW